MTKTRTNANPFSWEAIAEAERIAKLKSMPRQERWKYLGYTDEQIKIHLEEERRKAKETRECKRRNNERNKDIIAKLNKDLVGKEWHKHTILKIMPSIDGVGAWIHAETEYGKERIWQNFSDYDFEYFTKTTLKYRKIY